MGSFTRPGSNFAIENGGEYANEAEAANLAGHGLVGGLASVAGGGKFGSGFLAAGFSDAAGTGLGVLGPEYDNVVSASVTGGVGSVVGGGTFANGAVTGAFGYLFNSEGGKILGGIVGAVGSAVCDVVSDGACAPADPEMVTGGEAAGSSVGDLLEADGLQLLHSVESFNPSTISYWVSQGKDAIIDSLFGDDEPMLVKPDGTVMNGNSRIQALQNLGEDPNQLIPRITPRISTRLTTVCFQTHDTVSWNPRWPTLTKMRSFS